MAEILVVAVGEELVTATADLLAGAGHTVVTAVGFRQATNVLSQSNPDLMISPIRLAEYNGLHLLLRAQLSHPRLRAILLDQAHDSLTQSEARLHGAQYLVEPVAADILLEHVSTTLSTSPPRRWPRKKATEGMHARVEDHLGRVVDISYGGLCFDLPELTEVPAEFAVAFPSEGLVFHAKPVWTRVASDSLSCGAELIYPSHQAIASWRRFVDAIPDQPSEH
jgi:DNA-binding response OmpR family regulator